MCCVIYFHESDDRTVETFQTFLLLERTLKNKSNISNFSGAVCRQNPSAVKHLALLDCPRRKLKTTA